MDGTLLDFEFRGNSSLGGMCVGPDIGQPSNTSGGYVGREKRKRSDRTRDVSIYSRLYQPYLFVPETRPDCNRRTLEASRDR